MLDYVRKYAFYVVVFALIAVLVVFLNGKGCKPIDKFSPEIGNLKEGDTVYFDRIKIRSSDASEFEYADVLMFRTPDTQRNHFIARLIGKPGDKISYKDGVLVRNGVEISEIYVESKFKFNMPEILVASDSLFLLADNRSIDSNDSRKYGPIPFTHIVGRVTNAEE